MRPAFLLAILAVAVLVAACGSRSEGEPQLTVYLSAPLSGPRAADGQDVADGAQLAIEDAAGEAGGTMVTLATLDDAGNDGWDASRTGANARLAAQDSTAIAYVGELDSGASRTSVPITNEAGMLQVSPGSGAEDLTRAALGSSDVPSVQPSGARTFGRVIPSDRDQGEAAGVWMSEQGIAKVALIGGRDPFGEALVAGLESGVSAPAVVGAAQMPEAEYLATERTDAPGNPRSPGGIPLFASDAALERASGPRPDPAPPAPDRFTSAALDRSQLPAGADAFLADFRRSYGREPGRYAAYGYEAMAVVLDSIDRAGDPLSRSSVIDAFFATVDRDSILGRYSIDAVGNTTLPTLGAYLSAGRRIKPASRPIELP